MGFLSWALRPAHPNPLGEYELGCIRSRLPANEFGVPGLFAQIHYPSTGSMPAGKKTTQFPWFRTEVIQAIATGYGLSLSVSKLLLADCRQLDPSSCVQDPDGRQGWPVVIFSSGVYGSCEMYTQFCREMAATGMIVIAIEHEDGSGVYATSASTGEVIHNVSLMKIPPGKTAEAHRHPFMEQHADEIAAAAATIKNLRSKSDVQAESAEQDLLLSILRSADLDNMLLIGHSFGAAAIVRYLRRLDEQQKPCPFRGTVLLDTWGVALTKADTEHAIQIPFAMFISEEWASYGTPASDRIAKISGENYLGAAAVAGTHHQWVSESHYFAPHWVLRKIMIMGPVDFRKAHRATMLATRLAMEAIMDPSKRPDFAQKLKGVDQQCLVTS